MTGHTGFKGGWLSLWLHDMGAKVFGYALAPSTNPNLFELANVEQGITHTTGDLRSSEMLTASLRSAMPDIVFHLGAQSLVRSSYDDPVATFATNVMGTVHLLDSIVHLNREAKNDNRPLISAAIIVTSDKCYQNHEWPWGYRENDPLGGYDPYSSSKACAELVAAAFRSSFNSGGHPNVLIASARAGNVIGGGDWAPDRLVPDAVRALTSGKTLMIRNATAIRPWQHVLEPLGGYLLLAQKLICKGSEFAGAWNFGPDPTNECSVGDIVERLARPWGLSWAVDGGPRPHEAHYLRLDSSKARTLLGWKPRITLEDALLLTSKWYLAHKDGHRMLRDLTLSQIRNYASG
jgi:CDP-glucose 4,6-dehydratase